MIIQYIIRFSMFVSWIFPIWCHRFSRESSRHGRHQSASPVGSAERVSCKMFERENLVGLSSDFIFDRDIIGIILGKFDHDLTVLPHWESWYVYGNYSFYGLNSGWWINITYPDDMLRLDMDIIGMSVIIIRMFLSVRIIGIIIGIMVGKSLDNGGLSSIIFVAVQYDSIILVGVLEHVFSPYIENHHPNWLIFFGVVGQPPTRLCFSRFMYSIIFEPVVWSVSFAGKIIELHKGCSSHHVCWSVDRHEVINSMITGSTMIPSGNLT